ncbi:unnamed protein product [Arctogadus glacialis]
MKGEALSRLGEVFSRLRANNLKLAQKKCHFLRSEGSDDRTAFWVREQSPVRDEDDTRSRDLPILMVSPALDGLAGAGTPLSSPSSEPHVSPGIDTHPQSSQTSDRHTSRFGRVIKPVFRFIESMAQPETVLGVRPVSTVVHV